MNMVKSICSCKCYFHNEHIADLEAYIDLLHELNVITLFLIYSDGVKNKENPMPLNWNAETIVKIISM